MVEESKSDIPLAEKNYETKFVSGIVDFLPKYPNIEVIQYSGDTENIFSTYPQNKFNQEIFKKKEFYDSRIGNKEDFETFLTGNYQSHQKIIAKYMSSNTTYDGVLLYHALGSGKSSSAIAAIEQIRLEGKMTGALYIARGSGLIENFQAEILRRTGEMYRPDDDDIDEITDRAKRRRTKVKLGEFYSFATFETFAARIQKSEQYTAKQYSNHIIIIDEIHNIRLQDANRKSGSKLKIYDQFHKFLHMVEGSKVILMSGTPMKDNVEELSSVMNLLLPQNDQLPTGSKFLDEYFIKESKYLYEPKAESIPKLKNIFTGRVSFLASMESSAVTKSYMGVAKFGNLDHFTVSPNTMSKFQNKIYKQALQEDLSSSKILDSESKSEESISSVSIPTDKPTDKTTDKTTDRSGVYSKSRQASLFVYPDGSYGPQGFKKYIKSTKSSKGGGVGGIGGGGVGRGIAAAQAASMGVGGMSDRSEKARRIYSMSPELSRILRGDNNTETINNIMKYGCTYGASVKRILAAKRRGKNIFVYNEFVEGSGMIIFSLLLELVGFGITLSVPTTKADRYFIISDNIPTYLVNKIIELYNSPKNMNGEYIRVIIGSRKIGEGYSFSNIQLEEIQTPWFNYSQTYQAIARGLRFKSHDALIQARHQEGNFDPINVEIYQSVAMPINPEKIMSIDLNMYEISETKDISIKRVERIMKEAAFDCALNYARNSAPDQDGSRECDYMRCKYNCDGIPAELIRTGVGITEQDYSTFQLFYDSHSIEKLIKYILVFFSTRFLAYLDEIIADILSYTHFTRFQILTALRKTISESIPITDMYGFSRILKEDMNIYYLTSSVESSGSFTTAWYTENPYIKSHKTYQEEVTDLVNSKFKFLLHKLFTSETIEQVKSLWTQFDLDTREMILEFSIIAHKQKCTKNIKTRKLILDMLQSYISSVSGGSRDGGDGGGNGGGGGKTIVSSLLFERDNILRCLPASKPYKWVNCPDREIKEFSNIGKTVQTMVESEYGYYGIRNPTTDVFCIRDVDRGKTDEDRRKRTSGRNCETWDTVELLNLAVAILKIPLTDDTAKVIKTIKKINTAKITKGIISNPENPSKDELIEILNRKSTKNKDIIKMFNVKNTLPRLEILRIVYYASLSRKEICAYIREFFENKNLIQDDSGCGTNVKKKPTV